MNVEEDFYIALSDTEMPSEVSIQEDATLEEALPVQQDGLLACEECGKSYGGPNKRSLLKRHQKQVTVIHFLHLD